MNDSIDLPKTLIYVMNIGHILKIECKKQKQKKCPLIPTLVKSTIQNSLLAIRIWIWGILGFEFAEY